MTQTPTEGCKEIVLLLLLWFTHTTTKGEFGRKKRRKEKGERNEQEKRKKKRKEKKKGKKDEGMYLTEKGESYNVCMYVCVRVVQDQGVLKALG